MCCTSIPLPGNVRPAPAHTGHPPLPATCARPLRIRAILRSRAQKKAPGNPGGKNRLEREVFKTGLSAELKGIGQKETA